MNHDFGLRDHLGPSPHTGKVMSRLGMIPFNRLGVCLTHAITRLG